ncbi:HlyD family secretion protein [Rhodobacter sp. JA431]|uniref:HlyD family efflux transporter periplasmic adaptor subunit n=1 Tax=Rhodobacter sp. JA431 TaxID=570013 RepID=UPI000BDD0AA2|nr:HlyD family efflux transporter periplasmic adaptor subunit [Rhodobacter sp. JA431]SOC16244.1 HlyD family secretion protein [Rhodobacter sp. JA431]
MLDDAKLPLTDDGKAAPKKETRAKSARQGIYRRFKLWRVPLLVLFLFSGAVAGMYFQPPLLRSFFALTGLEPGAGSGTPIAVPAPTPVAPPKPLPPSITALGRLIPEGDIVRVSVPYGAGDARIERIMVSVGQVVSEGEVIAELDSLSQYRMAVTAAEANVAARQAALTQARASVATALAEAQANRDRAAFAAKLAADEADREKSLSERGATSRAALERATALALQAASELARAEALLARQQGGEDQPDVALAARQLDVARVELIQAEANLARGQVVAPKDGRIIALHVRVGEQPDADGIVSLGATDRMEAELEVYQTDIRRVSPGQPVTLNSAALAEPLTGSVIRIGYEVERQTVLSADPAANTDARIVRVTVALDAASSARAAALSGLEVTGRIESGTKQ